jgi:hypothetical protein
VLDRGPLLSWGRTAGAALFADCQRWSHQTGERPGTRGGLRKGRKPGAFGRSEVERPKPGVSSESLRVDVSAKVRFQKPVNAEGGQWL